MTLYMPLFRSCTTLRLLTQLHGHLFVSGLHNDPQPSTKLIESYFQLGSLKSSRFVFHTFPNPDSFMWGVLIKCHVWCHFFQEAISLYHHMVYNDCLIGDFIFSSILRACAGFGDLSIAEKIHGRIIKCGFDCDTFVETSLLGMYGDLGCVKNARKVFDNMSTRDVVSWSSIISCYVNNGEVNQGLEIFRSLVPKGVELDSLTMLSVADACGELGVIRQTRSVHGYILRQRFETGGPLDNSLVVMYCKCDDFPSAERVFTNMINKSVASWTAMISCYNRCGWFKHALEIFVEMLESKVEPNSVTIMAILSSCAGFGLLRKGKSVHCYAVKHADLDGEYLGPALIELYVKCSKMRYCEKLLRGIGKRNIISWNILISVYSSQGLLKEALKLFIEMQRQGLMPDSFSLSSSLSVCGEGNLLQLGHQIHGFSIKRNNLDEFVQNSLIDMYSKCSLVDSAYLIFDKIHTKSVVTWNSMICGLTQNGSSSEAFRLFHQMHIDCLDLNEVSFLAAIQACARIGGLEKGKWLHQKLITFGVSDIYVDTALIDMYSKCGELQIAQAVFDRMTERSLVSWSTMISGYGIHGNVEAAISLFSQMVESGIKPNDITFMNVLSACSHSGYVEQGKFYFNLMKNFGVKPSSEHYACMVDILSRAGDLNEAYTIIKLMPFPAEASIWCTLLNGCRIHQKTDMIRSIEKDLENMKMDDTGYFTLLSSIYAEEGNWKEYRNVRLAMEGSGLKKVPGYSTIELD